MALRLNTEANGKMMVAGVARSGWNRGAWEWSREWVCAVGRGREGFTCLPFESQRIASSSAWARGPWRRGNPDGPGAAGGEAGAARGHWRGGWGASSTLPKGVPDPLLHQVL